MRSFDIREEFVTRDGIADHPAIIERSNELVGMLLLVSEIRDSVDIAETVAGLVRRLNASGARAAATCLASYGSSWDAGLELLLEQQIDVAAKEIGPAKSFGWTLVCRENGRRAFIFVARDTFWMSSELAEIADTLNGPGSGRLDSGEQTAQSTISLDCISPNRIATDATATLSSIVTTLSRRQSDAVRSLAGETQCNLGVVLVACAATLFHRYSSSSELSVVSDVPTRTQVGSPYVADLVHSILLRIDFSSDPSILQVLERTQRAIDAGVQTRDVRVDNVAVAQVHGDPVQSTPSRISFDLRPADFSLHDNGPLLVRRVRSNSANDHDNIQLRFAVVDNEIILRWRFDSGVHDRGSVDQTSAHFVRLIESIVGDPERPVSRLQIISADERTRIITNGQGVRRAYERDLPVHEIWARQVHQTPDAIALVDLERELTYAETDRRANQLANYLIAVGVKLGSMVGIAFERCIDLPIALLAVLKAGGIYVPLDLTYPHERLEVMIADAGVAFIIARGIPDLPASFAGTTISIDLEAAAIAACKVPAPHVAVGARAQAYIMYTSGSTGRPKGVGVSHRGIARLVRGADYADIGPDEGYVHHAPLSFDASTFEIWTPLLNGQRLGIPRPGLLTMEELALAIGFYRVTTMFLTTALFNRLVESDIAAFGLLRQLLTGGEVASPRHMERFLTKYPKCRLIAVYGPTENTTFSTWLPLLTKTAIGTSVPIGRPIANSSAYVVDDHGELVPVGVTGELWVGGDGVADGYLQLPQITRERFTDDPFKAGERSRIYKTGDRARWRTDGVLEFLGRNDDQVKIRGHRIELGEIESVLRSHPGVRDAAAVVTATDDGEKSILAYVVRGDISTLEQPDIRAHLAVKLPRYMHPQTIHFIADLPVRTNGKVDRDWLARRARPSCGGDPTEQSAKAGLRQESGQRGIQQEVTEIWRTTLRLDRRPDINENFFDAGGDSLLLLTLHAKLTQRLDPELRITDLFEHTTIRKITVFLSAPRPR